MRRCKGPAPCRFVRSPVRTHRSSLVEFPGRRPFLPGPGCITRRHSPPARRPTSRRPAKHGHDDRYGSTPPPWWGSAVRNEPDHAVRRTMSGWRHPISRPNVAGRSANPSRLPDPGTGLVQPGSVGTWDPPTASRVADDVTPECHSWGGMGLAPFSSTPRSKAGRRRYLISDWWAVRRRGRPHRRPDRDQPALT